MPDLNFTKMHGLGNDFIVVDNRDGNINLDSSTINKLANRRTGIGFDQLLVVESASVPEAEFDYRIYNADGGEVEHCGNGARCFAKYVTDKGLTTSAHIKVKTVTGILTLKLVGNDNVTVQMGVPTFVPKEIPFIANEQANYYDVDVNGKTYKVGAAGISNPHVLLQVDNIDTADVETLGPMFESHERFPNRVNVGFMQLIDSSNIRLRVYERGVGETQACGSGACAAVAIGIQQGLLDKRMFYSL